MSSGWLEGDGPPSSSPVGGGRDQEGQEIRVGEIYGARTFLVSPDGWLHGVFMKRRWDPGINTAQCWRPTGHVIPGVGIASKVSERRSTELGQHWTYTVEDETGTYEGYLPTRPAFHFGNQDDPNHKFSDCKCGLYAFMRGSMDYSYDRRAISGVVRAHGRVSVGSRGFRAQYAEIVALYIPETEAPERGGISRVVSMHEGLRRAHLGKAVTPEILERISENYPEVPLYFDLDEMLTFHPTEEPS